MSDREATTGNPHARLVCGPAWHSQTQVSVERGRFFVPHGWRGPALCLSTGERDDLDLPVTATYRWMPPLRWGSIFLLIAGGTTLLFANRSALLNVGSLLLLVALIIVVTLSLYRRDNIVYYLSTTAAAKNRRAPLVEWIVLGGAILAALGVSTGSAIVLFSGIFLLLPGLLIALIMGVLFPPLIRFVCINLKT